MTDKEDALDDAIIRIEETIRDAKDFLENLDHALREIEDRVNDVRRAADEIEEDES